MAEKDPPTRLRRAVKGVLLVRGKDVLCVLTMFKILPREQFVLGEEVDQENRHEKSRSNTQTIHIFSMGSRTGT